MSQTHRCIDCAQLVEHEETELCPSCGRCKVHCYGATGVEADNALYAGGLHWHRHMRKVGDNA